MEALDPSKVRMLTADRIFHILDKEARTVMEKSVRDEIIRAAREQDLQLLDGVELTVITKLVPSDPSKPLDPNLVGMRGRAYAYPRHPEASDERQ